MCSKIEKNKIQNIDKIRTGSCIELLCLLDNLFSDFDRLQNFISENQFLFCNQRQATVSENFYDIKSIVAHNVDILLDDIDPEENYNDFMIRYY